MKFRIISFVLVLAFLCTSTTPVFATSTEVFLSDVALVYEDSVEDAKKAIKNTDWKLFEKDLNPNADYIFDNGVYLIYKTTTNVEEAITDLRVMDMYGGYSISDYERQLEASRQSYLALVSFIRIVSAEFKMLYDAGDEMAKLAYRQMNYYKDIGETNMLMGDFLLNIPSDAALVTVMMQGNSTVFSNLLSLLAIGISGASDQTLATKVAEYYEIKDTLTAEKYHETAAKLSEQIETLQPIILRYDDLIDEYDLESEEITEEEFQFMSTYMPYAVMLAEIKLGDTNLADMIRKGTWQVSDLYPIVAALTTGQMALVEMGQLNVVLKYSTPSKPIEELTDIVLVLEEGLKDENGNLKHIDVYIGVDRTIFKGAFAMTNAAERQQALTGKTWTMSDAHDDSTPFYIASGILFAADFTMASVIVGALVKAKSLAKAYQTALEAYNIGKVTTLVHLERMAEYKAFAELWFPRIHYMGITCIGLSLIIAGLSGFSTWYNYYNPDYAEIPNVLIDVRETDLGDQYVKYTAAKVFDQGDKNADFNAYEGKEWIALYYTKDANAGNSLTPNFVYRENNATVSRRHQGVSMFGETNAFNLNSHVYKDDAKGIYLSVRYSNTKKAAAELPDVVGSMVGSGPYYMLSGLAGVGVGMGAMGLFQQVRKKKNKQS